jgi:hypothetical protein
MRYIDTVPIAHPGPRSQAIHWVPWKRLSADALEKHILECLRLAGEGNHLNEQEWRLLDRKRKRLARLTKEAV